MPNIGSGNGLSPVRRQAIIYTNVDQYKSRLCNITFDKLLTSSPVAEAHRKTRNWKPVFDILIQMAANFLTTIWNVFSWMKIYNFDFEFTEGCSQGSN